MSIDEMLAGLKTIEDGLSKKILSADSIKCLETLAGYYRHQQDQLKGFEKDPKKLQDNLAIMDGWIKDIGVLMKSNPESHN